MSSNGEYNEGGADVIYDYNTWLFSEEAFMKHSPSRKQLTVSQELKTREAIHDFVIRLGTALKLDSRTILAATVYINRYYMRLPVTTSKYFVACAALAISCKLNDNYRQPDKIAMVACSIKNPNRRIDEQSDIFWQWRDQLLYREELILKNLNFDLNLELPYSIRDDLMKTDGEDNSPFVEMKSDILKNAVSLIEMLSSLPILVAYDVRAFFGAMLVLTVLEAREKFKNELIIPKHYLSKILQVDSISCYQCYQYILRLLKYCDTKNSQTSSHKNTIKRIRYIDEATFFNISND